MKAPYSKLLEIPHHSGDPVVVPAGQFFTGVHWKHGDMSHWSHLRAVEFNSAFTGPATMTRLRAHDVRTDAILYLLIYDDQVMAVWAEESSHCARLHIDRRYHVALEREAARRGLETKELGAQAADAFQQMPSGDSRALVQRISIPGAGSETWEWLE